MRDRLIELLKTPHKAEKLRQTGTEIGDYEDDCIEAMVADFLLSNGVIVPPVAVGQICYQVYMGEILEVRVVSISYEPLPAFSYTIRFNSLGVLCLLQDGTRNEAYSWDIYITREEAEKALKEAE